MNVSEEITQLAQQLICFESVETKPDQLKAILDSVEDYLRRQTSLHLNRFEVEGKHSLVATFKKTKSPEVFFHDHLDVVPGSPEQFRPVIKGRKLWGRGASDTKGNGAILLVLAKEWSKLSDPGPRRRRDTDLGSSARPGTDLAVPNVGFMFTTDEEIGGHRGTKFLLDRGYRCQFFVTAEPTSFALVPSHKGILWLKVKVKGRSAHGSRPWDGENAVLKAYQGLNVLYELFPIPPKAEWKTTVNLGGLSGGDAFNKVVGECELKLDIRYIEKDRPEDILRKVHQCFPGSQIEVVTEEPAMQTAFDDPYIVKFSKVIEKVLGSPVDIHRGHGACDGRFYSSLGMPAVQFGTPSKGLHTDEEWLRLDTLANCYKILWEFVDSLGREKRVKRAERRSGFEGTPGR